MRDAADLYLSLKNQPVVFINDTPCRFVRPIWDPETAHSLWGDKAGCFEKPIMGKRPDQQAQDYGGPRKEFFRLVLLEIKEKYFDNGLRELLAEEYTSVGTIMGIIIFILLGVYPLCAFHVFLLSARNDTRLLKVVDFTCSNFLNLQPVDNNQLAASLLISRNRFVDSKLLQAT